MVKHPLRIDILTCNERLMTRTNDSEADDGTQYAPRANLSSPCYS